MSSERMPWDIRLRTSRTSGQTIGRWTLSTTRGEAIEFATARLRDITGYESDPELVDTPPGPHARLRDRQGHYRVEIRARRQPE